MHSLLPVVIVAGLLLPSTPPVSARDVRQPAKADDIKLVPIKATEVEKVVSSHKGKVVVLDVWAEF